MDIRRTNKSSFDYRSSFGSSVSFSSLSEGKAFGDGHKKMMPKGINSLKMSMSLSFNELTDDESNELISFLQSQYYYSPQNYNSNGSFDNQRITPFKYQPFFPYKRNEFYCLSFNHKKTFYNSNQVTATFLCAHPSILTNVEISAHHSPRISALLTTSNSVPGSDLPQSIDSTAQTTTPFWHDPGLEDHTCNFNKGDILFESGNYRSVINSSNNAVYSTSDPDINVSGLARFGHSAGSMSFQGIRRKYDSARRSMFISDVSEFNEYPYPPIHEGGTSDYRMFDFSPSYSMDLKNSPKYKTSTPSEVYERFVLYGFNPNLMNFRLTFSHRTDLEAKRILFFLESHLGYKKFGFHLPQPYHNTTINSIHHTPHRRTYSHFYCPEWGHSINYKDNHTITATFIECMDY